MPANMSWITGLDLEVSGSAQVLLPESTDLFRVQPIVETGTWGAAIITVEWSLTGGTTAARWSTLDDPLTLDNTDEDAISVTRYVECMRFLRFRVSTNQSGTPGELGIVVAYESSSLAKLQSIVDNTVTPS